MSTTLLEVTGTLTAADAKTVRSFAFDVPEGTEAMALVVEWTPHFSDDVARNTAHVEAALATWGGTSLLTHPDVTKCQARLPNLLNAVVVEPSGRWRGRSDRGKATRAVPLVVDPVDPGPGFMPGALTPGRWSVDLEVHSVVVDQCEFFLQVTTRPAAKQSSRPTERFTAVAASDPVKTSPSAPGFVRGELHTHTRHSDGSHTVAELLHRARELGLDFIALTDHNTTSGCDELFASSFPGILGAELTTFRGHHVVLGLDEMVPWHAGGRVLDVNEVVRAVKGKGALFTLTHPFNLGDPICTGCRWMTPELDVAQVNLIEVWHRRWTGDVADNQQAYDLWNDLWKQGHRPTAIGVRDWHNKQHEASLPGPLPTTVLRSSSLRQADLLDALRRGAAYVTRGPHLAHRIGEAQMGDVFPAATGAAAGETLTVDVDLDLKGVVPRARLDLWRDGAKVASQDVVDGQRAASFQDRVGAGFWRVELRDADDAPLAIANHVVLQ